MQGDKLYFRLPAQRIHMKINNISKDRNAES
jgi:hypothetical protein